MIATPAEFAALVAAGWEPSSVSVWTAEGNATLLRRGDAVLHVTVTEGAAPVPTADQVTLLLPVAAPEPNDDDVTLAIDMVNSAEPASVPPEHDVDGVTLIIPAGAYWTSGLPESPVPDPVPAGSALELADFCMRPKPCRPSRTNTQPRNLR